MRDQLSLEVAASKTQKVKLLQVIEELSSKVKRQELIEKAAKEHGVILAQLNLSKKQLDQAQSEMRTLEGQLRSVTQQNIILRTECDSLSKQLSQKKVQLDEKDFHMFNLEEEIKTL